MATMIADSLGIFKDAPAISLRGMDMTKQFEGFRGTPYTDPAKTKDPIPVIGYGFRLDNPNIRKMIPRDVLSGERPLDVKEADQIFPVLYKQAVNDAIDYVGRDNFDKLDQDTKDNLVDMSYQLGSSKLNGFVEMRKALINNDKSKIADEMKNSRWYEQSGRRGRHHVETMKGKRNFDDLSFLNPFNTPDASADEVSSTGTIKDSAGIFNQDPVENSTPGIKDSLGIFDESPQIKDSLGITGTVEGPKPDNKWIGEGIKNSFGDVGHTLSSAADHIRAMGLDKKLYEAEVNREKGFVNFLPPDMRKAFYGTDDPVKAFEIQKGNLDSGVAFGTSSVDKLLFGLPSLAGKVTGMDSGISKEIQDKHKVATMVGEATGDLGSLLATSSVLGATKLPGAAKKVGDVTSKYWAASTRFLPKAIMTSSTFATDTALQETFKQAREGKFDPLETGKKVIESGSLGALFGGVGGVVNTPIAVISASGIGYGYAKYKGASELDAVLNGLVFGAFEAVGSFGRDPRLRMDAINTIKSSMTDWATKQGLHPADAAKSADVFMAETAKEAGGMDHILKSKENTVGYLEDVNKKIQIAITKPDLSAEKPGIEISPAASQPAKPSAGEPGVQPMENVPLRGLSTDGSKTKLEVSEPVKPAETQPEPIPQGKQGIVVTGQDVYNDIRSQQEQWNKDNPNSALTEDQIDANATMWKAHAEQASKQQGISVGDWYAKVGPQLKSAVQAPSPGAMTQGAEGSKIGDYIEYDEPGGKRMSGRIKAINGNMATIYNAQENRSYKVPLHLSKPIGDGGKLFQSSPQADTFYSQAAKVIDEKMPNAATPEMIKGILSDKNGVKAEELKWMGLDDFLAGKKKVTKQELKDFIEQNQVRIKEKTLSNNKVDKELKKLKEDTDFARQQKSDIESAFGGVNVYSSGLPPKWGYKNDEGKFTVLGDKFQGRLDEISDIIQKHDDMVDKLGDDYFSPAKAKFASYQLPGGENYRELLLTLPPKVSNADEVVIDKTIDDLVEEYNISRREAVDGIKNGNYQVALTAQQRKNLDNLVDAKFTSSHFDEPNVLAHVRMNDRVDADGKKVLFVEEVQSDWHQKGRKEGYNVPDRKGRVEKAKHNDRYGIVYDDGTKYPYSFPTKEEAQQFLDKPDLKTGVPDAPFKKTWHELAMKRMLRYAAENGYDRLAWTTGEQQAERYDLSRQVKGISYWKNPKGEYQLRIVTNANEDVNKLVQENELENFVGKDVAKKIIDGEGKASGRVTTYGESVPVKMLEGLDLKVGGEGMKGFYDQILPSFMNKYAKKWGGRVGQSRIDVSDKIADAAHLKFYSPNNWYTEDEKINIQKSVVDGKYRVWDYRIAGSPKEIGTFDTYEVAKERISALINAEIDKTAPVHSIDITPSMKKSVLEEGQPLFQGGQQPRGWVELKPGEKTNLILTARRDASTFMHESAHIWLQDMFEFSKVNKTNKQFFMDWGTMIDWLEIKPDQKVLRRDQHEQFARGLEAYLWEGKAPSEELRSVFEKFKEWLRNIYKSIKELKVKLNDDVRNFYDKMFSFNEKMGNKGSVPNQSGKEPIKPEKSEPITLYQTGKPQYSEQGKSQIRQIGDLLASSDNPQLIQKEDGSYTRLQSGWPDFLTDRGYTRKELDSLFSKALNDQKLTDAQIEKLDGIMADYRDWARINPPTSIQERPTAGNEGQAEKEKQRKFIKNVKEAEKTSPEVARMIESYYTVIGNAQTLQEAKDLIAKDINAAQDLVEGNEPPTRVSNTVALLLIDKAQSEGRFEDVKRLVERTAEKNTALGQTIQALSMYRRLSPEGILRYAERVIRQAEEKQHGGQQKGYRPPGFKTKFDKELVEKLTKMSKGLGSAPQWEMPSTPEAKNAIQDLIESFYKMGVDGENSLPAEVKNAIQFTIEQFQKLGVEGVNTPEARKALQVVFEGFQKLGVEGENTPMGPGVQTLMSIGHSYASRKNAITTALMLKEIQKRVDPGILRKISMGQILAQLLNTKTMIRNIFGNFALVPVENLSDVVGTAIDISASFLTGQRTMWLPNPKTQAMGFIQGLKEGTEEALLGINLRGLSTKFDLPKNSVFDNKVLNGFEKLLSVSLGAPDRAFYQATFNDSIRRQLQGRSNDSLTPEMIERAHFEGLYRTFQDRTVLSQAFESLKKALNYFSPGNVGVDFKDIKSQDWGLGDAVLKYAKTPANLLSRGIEYSPFGFLDTAWQIGRKFVFKKQFDQYKFVHSFSRALVGSVLLVGSGALLASLGIITGRAEDDKDVRNAQSDAGIKGYQINLSALKRFLFSGMNKEAAALREDDVMVSYDWMQPAAIGLALGANAYLAREKSLINKAVNLADSAFTAANTIAEQPLVSGLKTLTSRRGLPEGVAEVTKGIPASFIPTFLSQVRQLTDNVSRNTKAPWWNEMGNRVINKIPGASRMLPPNVTPLGKPRQMYQNDSNNPFNVFLNPAFVTKYKPDQVSRMVLDLWKRSGHTEQFPRTQYNRVSFGQEQIELTASQTNLYQTYIGERTDNLFTALANNPSFMRSSDDQQAKRLQRELTSIRDEAKRKFFEVKRDPNSRSVEHIFRAISSDMKKINGAQ